MNRLQCEVTEKKGGTNMGTHVAQKPATSPRPICFHHLLYTINSVRGLTRSAVYQRLRQRRPRNGILSIACMMDDAD